MTANSSTTVVAPLSSRTNVPEPPLAHTSRPAKSLTPSISSKRSTRTSRTEPPPPATHVLPYVLPISTSSTNRQPSTLQPFDSVEQPSTSSPMTRSMRKQENMIFAAMCLALFLAGWNDASAGPLLPRMQSYWHIGYVVVSMIFVCNCVGFLASAVMNVWLTDKFGFGWVITGASVLQPISYVIQATRPPFPVMAISYAINGYGQGIQDAQANGMIATLPTSANSKMSMLHGVYGFGAFVSPLIATQFSKTEHWNFHFLCSLGIALINTAALAWVTRFKTQEVLLNEVGVQPQDDSNEHGSKFRQIMQLKLVHLMAFFILVYVGTEVTIGGWIVTFVLDKRGAGANAGYVSSGFFGGLTIGRVILIWINRRIGEQRVIYIYGVACIALELTIWFVPSLIENAVAVAFVGLFLGPFYPIVMNVASALIPRRLLTGAIGWIASIGQTGSAAFPFILALMAEKYGVQVLQPLLVAMLVFLLGVWFFVPSIARHSD